MDYNTKKEALVMPEYGRIIQNMVDYALTIEERSERQRCANTIIKVMGSLFPHLRDVPDFTHKLWDHLAIMSGYKLDIDCPYDITPPKDKSARPDKIPYPTNKINYRHYGLLLENSIKKALTMEDGKEKEILVAQIANQMKRSLASWNKDAVGDGKIASDLARYTNGKIKLDLDNFRFAPLPIGYGIANQTTQRPAKRRIKKN